MFYLSVYLFHPFYFAFLFSFSKFGFSGKFLYFLSLLLLCFIYLYIYFTPFTLLSSFLSQSVGSVVNFFISYRCSFYVLSIHIFISLPLLCFPLFFNTLVHSFTVFVYYFFLSILPGTLTSSIVPSISKAKSMRPYCRLVHSYTKAVPVTSARKLYPRMTEHGHKV